MNTRIGVTLGDPLGIGPEIVLRALPQFSQSNASFVVYGSPNFLETTAKRFSLPTPWKNNSAKFVTIRPSGPDPKDGSLSSPELRARAVIESLQLAAHDAESGEISALVTGPIDKAIVRTILPSFTGHTGYLAEKAHRPNPVMMLDNRELRVGLLTEHIPLREVANALTSELLVRTVRVAIESLKEWFGIMEPRIAVAGLNPHAGEITPNSEEELILKPAIQNLRHEGIRIEGPFPADSLFSNARNGKWDLLLSPYHDQGLVAAKYPGREHVVNITLGLPYLRVSPGHGVAYDVVGTGKGDPRSLERAIRVAIHRRLDV